eukprot:TRINITY_DN6000_c1_g1_i1.p1 TRINITY_DN6000_c1_g1~~TRINITY_DN6000_c1_g1_i1.p1  ORF type:complete len:850 (+),score=164.62 TRINITY_DN6000_c1_g1_i1:31-2580(+)
MPVPYGQNTKKDLVMRANRGDGNAEKMSESMRVFLRIRPYLDQEKVQLENNGYDVSRSSVELDECGEVLIMDDNCLLKSPTVSHKVRKRYPSDAFDEAFWSFGEDSQQLWRDDIRHNNRSQSYIFRTLNRKNTATVVDSLYNGFNHCFMTYGCVNSGKTHTMFGTTSDPGLAPRFVEKIVSKIPSIESKYADESLKVRICISFARVHKEQLEDCLSRDILAKADLEKISTMDCRTEQQLQVVLSKMQKLRKPSSKIDAGGKDNSSHMVVSVNIIQDSEFKSTEKTCRGEKPTVKHTRHSCLTLVDLGTATRSDGETPQDIRLISQAPQAVARVFHSLSLNSSSKSSIPYRDSILTYYLQECLGGNCSTSVICCVDPNYKHHNDSILSIDTTKKLRNIVTHLTANTDKTLTELRTLNQEKVEVTGKIQKLSNAAQTVKDALSERQQAISRLESEKKIIQKRLREERHIQDRISQYCKESQLCFSAIRVYRRRLLSIYDVAIKTSRANRSATRKLISELKQKIAELEALESQKAKQISDLTVRVNTAAKLCGFAGLDLNKSLSPKAAREIMVSDTAFNNTAKVIVSNITQNEALIASRRQSHQQCGILEKEIVAATVELSDIEKEITHMTQQIEALEDDCAETHAAILSGSCSGGGGGTAAGSKSDSHADPVIKTQSDLRRALSDLRFNDNLNDLLQEEELVRSCIISADKKFRARLPNVGSMFQRISRASRENQEEQEEVRQLKAETVEIKQATEVLQESLYAAQETAAAKEGELEALKLAYQAALEEARWRRQQESEEKARERQYEEDRKKREDELALARVQAASDIAAQQSKAPPAPKKGEGGCCAIS